jgi:NTE family protein
MTKASDARPHPVRNRPPFECIALVLQGGGALGAYQAGVYQALDEAGLDPDWISGISIGAFNSAIIAGNPPGVRVEKLREFWESVTQPFVDWHPPAAWLAEAEASGSLAPQPSDFWTFASNLLPALNFDASRGLLNQWAAGRVLWNGTPGFFALRPVTPWFWPGSSVRATSYYDTSALKETLERLIDFDRINDGPTRLSVGAVNVQTGNFVFSTRPRTASAPNTLWQAARCRRHLRPSRSTANIIGTAGLSQTRRCAGWSTAARNGTPWSSRSISGRRAAIFPTTWLA